MRLHADVAIGKIGHEAMSKSNKGAMTPPNGMAFRALLRHWRTIRGLSQFALAEDAGISTRHLSFLETGRSLPSRDMVQRLADGLALPSADTDVLLLSAGYAPAYTENPITPPAFETQERMLEAILAQHKSMPALVIDEDWNIRMRNTAAARVFGRFRQCYGLPESVAHNAMHILCHPDGLRQFMADWSAYAAPFVRAVNREASMEAGSAAEGLRDALFDYAEVPAAAELSNENAGNARRPLTMRLQAEDMSLSFYTAFTTFELPFALKPRQIKIEYLVPADPATAEIVDRLCKSPS